MIIELEDTITSEFKGNNQSMEGKINIGCGEFMAMEILAGICSKYREKYPLVQLALHTGTADHILERMNKGLVDVGLFLEPVNTEGLDYIRIRNSDHWVVTMRADDPLAKKNVITKKDLLHRPLILPERMNVQSELVNWFGEDFNKVQAAFTSNLGTNAGVFTKSGLGYPVSIEGAAKSGQDDGRFRRM
ncbi:MAG TPA: LysR family transcriptional regulator substrate-binding protein [Lachnospiraceae bacterium]|nr:LysR family transcriptional regulator substrate-binding protein [Lachnospiraceae bacterium]